MTADDQTRPAARAAALLHRGPAPVPRRSPRERLRALLRATLLRAAQPHARYQREIDEAILAGVDRAESELERLGERHEEQIERLEDLVRELVLSAEALRRGVADVAAAAATATAGARRQIDELTAELYALPYIAGCPFERMDSPVGEVLGFRASPPEPGETSAYVAFEELFRGPSERVAESQRPYLALVADHQPVLDVGCGRGEFLALLAGEGILARGVDSDAGMVERCRELGLEATHDAAEAYVASLPDRALGTLFSAQLIEHLPEAELRHLLELARRKLRPGGLLIAETVNPHRLSSLKNFWVDLTHQHPIFPEVALAMCMIAGFETGYVFAPGFASFEHARFLSPAYAVVASAPHDPAASDDPGGSS